MEENKQIENQSAFPGKYKGWCAGESYEDYLPGMTLRDYFAAKAMQAMISTLNDGPIKYDMVSLDAYEMADSMLFHKHLKSNPRG